MRGQRPYLEIVIRHDRKLMSLNKLNPVSFREFLVLLQSLQVEHTVAAKKVITSI